MPKQTDAVTIDDTKEVDPAEANTELPNGEVETEISEGDVPTPTGESVDEDLEDDAEAEEPAAEEDEEKPKADKPAKGEDQEARRDRLLTRLDKWGEPVAAQPKAEAKEEPKAEDKKPEPRKPSEKLKTARAKFAEKYGEDDAKDFQDPLADELESTRAELDGTRAELADLKAQSKKTSETLSKIEEREQARSLEVALDNTNRLGKEVAAVAAKGYEHVFGKVGAYDPRTDRFKDSTEAQNQNIAKFNQKTIEYLSKSRAAGDPLSIEDARELALMKLEKDDPAFKRNVAAEKTAEQRQRQITQPPTRHKPGRAPGADAKEDPYAAAKQAAKSGYAQFLGKNRE